MSKSFTIWNKFFPLLFPKDSEYLKSLDIVLWEVGAKRPLNGMRTCDGHITKHTIRHTNISTYRKHRPTGWGFEKTKLNSTCANPFGLYYVHCRLDTGHCLLTTVNSSPSIDCSDQCILLTPVNRPLSCPLPTDYCFRTRALSQQQDEGQAVSALDLL